MVPNHFEVVIISIYFVVLLDKMSDKPNAAYFNKLFNDEHPVKLGDLDDCPAVKQCILYRIRTTNEDGSMKDQTKAKEVRDCTDADRATSIPALVNGVETSLNPFKDYYNHGDVGGSPNKTPCGKHTRSGVLIDASAVCVHCKLPLSQCAEKLFGPQMTYFFKKAAMKVGVIDYPNHGVESDEDSITVYHDFNRLLTELKFAVAVMNGKWSPMYSGNGDNPFLHPFVGSNLNDTHNELGAMCIPKSTLLPKCVVEGSYATFKDWLAIQKSVHEWGYDIYPGAVDFEMPMDVVNYYRCASDLSLNLDAGIKK